MKFLGIAVQIGLAVSQAVLLLLFLVWALGVLSWLLGAEGASLLLPGDQQIPRSL